MIGLSVYSFNQSYSNYIKELKKNQLDMTFVEKNHLLKESPKFLILDFTSEQNVEVIENICQFLFTIQVKKVETIFLVVNKSTAVERLIYLNMGVTLVFDDYTTPEEFGMIVFKFINKQNMEFKILQKKELHKDEMSLNPMDHSVCLENGKIIYLTPLEYRLIHYLKEHRNSVCTYEEIHQLLWQRSIGNNPYRVANLIFHLRTKLGKEKKTYQLQTIRSIGYMYFVGNN